VLVNVFDKMVRLLHPFMPFVSEEIWQVIRPYLDEPNLAAHLPIAKYPEASSTNPLSPAEETAMNHCIEATEAINSLRSLMGIHPGQKISASFKALFPPPGENNFSLPSTEASFITDYDRWISYLSVLGKVESARLIKFHDALPPHSVPKALQWCEIFVTAPSDFDFAKTQSSIRKKRDELEGHLRRHEARLNNEDFARKAGLETFHEMQDKVGELKVQITVLEEQLRLLSSAA
jgi:valyl-tRNA synthetase